MRARFAAIAVSAACGSGATATVDGSLIDGTPADAAPSVGDPTPTAVAVTVTALGSPVVGATAYFQRADGTVVATRATDEHGLAWAELAAGGYATVYQRPVGEIPQLATFTDLQPGDRVRLDRAPAPLATLAITLALPPAHAYTLYSSCGDELLVGGAPQLIGLTPCHAALDLVAVASDGSGALVAPGLQLVVGQSVDLSAQVVQPFATATLAFSNVPASVPFVGAYEAVLSPRGRSYSASTGVAVAAGTAGASLAMPALASDAVALAVTAEFPGPTDIGAQSVYQWPAGVAYALDVAANRLPAFASAPTVSTTAIAWGESTGPLAANVTRATITIDRAGLPSDTTVRWQIAAAHAGAALALPTLPGELAPRDGDTLAIVDLTTAHVPGGYPAIRTDAFADLANAIDATTPGTLAIQTLAPAPL